MLKRKLLVLLVLMVVLMAGCACAQTQVTDMRTDMGENHVIYPQLEGMADAKLQSMINDDIVLSSGVTNHLVTLVTLGQGGAKLKVNYSACLLDDAVFSTVIQAQGSRVGGQRDGHAYTALTYDLTTGRRITLADLFTDVEVAVAQMEQLAVASLSEELNGYMEYSQLTPLPCDSFTLDEHGITFWYPADQFQLLSGKSGACQFWYEELDGLWRTDGLPALIWPKQELTDAQRREQIVQSVQEGVLPHVPAQMGQSMDELTGAYGLVRTPDAFPGGRYYVLEDPAFRSILVISDALEGERVEGIQLKRGALCGLVIGDAKSQQWRRLLGDPAETVTMTENMAYDYNLPAGAYDVYTFGENELRLYADEGGVLCAIQLSKSYH